MVSCQRCMQEALQKGKLGNVSARSQGDYSQVAVARAPPQCLTLFIHGLDDS